MGTSGIKHLQLDMCSAGVRVHACILLECVCWGGGGMR